MGARDYARGKRVVARLPHGGDLLEEIAAVADAHGMQAAELRAIGALKGARLAFYDQATQVYGEFAVDEPVELVGLLGNPHAIGNVFGITSDELLTWDQIHQILGRAAGAEPQIVHVPSDLINAYDARWGAELLGDKTPSVIFDNRKIKRVVPDFCCTIPFARGAEEIIAWYDSDPRRQVADPLFDGKCDEILAAYARAWPAGAPWLSS